MFNTNIFSKLKKIIWKGFLLTGFFSFLEGSVVEPEPRAEKPKLDSRPEPEPKLQIAVPALALAPPLFYSTQT